jgi:hypothetical protein
MTGEAWGFFSVLTTVVCGTFVELVRTRRRLDRSAAAGGPESDGEECDEQSPRGFRASVLASLQELKTGQGELRQRLDRHLGDHASSDLRRPGRRARE